MTLKTGDSNVCTVASDTGNEILIGTTSGAASGSAIGVISDISKSGTHVYTLGGALSFTDSIGRPYTTVSLPTDVSIEIIHFEI